MERSGGQIGTWECKVCGTPEMAEADAYYVDRMVKFLLWSWGGFKVYICGDDALARQIQKAYTATGTRAFDKDFMENVYEREFQVVSLPYESRPAPFQKSESVGRHTNGARIGFDAGGSDRKVSAVIDGETIYSEEVVWYPKVNPNPDYHYLGILAACATAAAKIMEKGRKVDGIGVSSAGVYIDNKCMVASLFIKVGKADFERRSRTSTPAWPRISPVCWAMRSRWWWPTTATCPRWRAPWAWARTASWASPWAPARPWAMWTARATSAAG